MRTIAVVNQKGGCGKTTTAINLAAVYARRGLRTLLVDVDPQAHCAAGLGVPEKRVEHSIGEAMLADPARSVDRAALVWEVARNLDLAPSTMRLAALEAPGGGLHELPDRDLRLKRVLEQLEPHYDRCLIDCPPTLGLLTFNALRAAREALIPIETGYFSLKGAERQWETIQRVIKYIGRPIACHMLPTLYDAESKLATDILAALRRRFAGQILPIVMHEHEQLREAASVGQAITEYAPGSAAWQDCEDLANWLEDHPIQPAVEIEIINDKSTAHPARCGESPHGGTTPSAVDQDHLHTGGDRSANIAGGRAAELADRLRNLSRRSETPQEPQRSSVAVAKPLPAGEPTATSRRVVEVERSVAPAEVEENPEISTAQVQEHLPESDEKPRTPAADLTRRTHEPTHLFGVRCTSQGVLFVQPNASEDPIFVAGDFNGWSPTAMPLRYNGSLGVREVIVRIPPGRYRYRLVVGRQWRPDPYNGAQDINEHGEANSVLIVPEAPTSQAQT